MKRKKKKPTQTPKLPLRNRRIVFNLNEAEWDALCVYCKRYHISNRSKLIRQILLAKIAKQFNEDYPTLF